MNISIESPQNDSASEAASPGGDRDVRVLLIEDDHTQILLLRAALSKARFMRFSFEVEERLFNAESRLARERFDIILTDLGLPDSQGLESFKRVFAAARGTPVMVMTAQENDELGLQAMAAGAQDYLVKHEVTGDLLVRALRYSIERSRLQEQLRQSQKMEAVGQLAGGVAHDFNNLLTIIHGYSEILLARHAGQEDLVSAVRPIQVAALRAAGLTRQLLAFGRRQMMSPVSSNLNEIVDKTAKTLPRVLSGDIRLQLRLAPALPPVHADPAMIEQVLMNLALNSRDAMPFGGQLTLSTFVQEIDGKNKVNHPEGVLGRYVCLEVADTGCGIAAEVLPHIFEPFYSIKNLNQTTGLGLASVHGMIKQHGGWVEVVSQPGVGTRFTIYLPASDSIVQVIHVTPSQPVVRGRETILLVEDQPTLREMISAVLTSHGYVVLEAANGAEALGVWKANSTHIDLLLTDMEMPGGINGRELAKSLLAENKSLCVVYSSGYSINLFGEDSLLEEGVNFLAKPYVSESLLSIVQGALAHRPA